MATRKKRPSSSKAESSSKSEPQSAKDEAAADQTAAARVEAESSVADIYELADQLRHEDEEADAAPREKAASWVTFRVDQGIYGLPVERVQEVIKVGPITPVPHTPRQVSGVTNLRGRVLTVVDLRARLALPHRTADEHSRILVSLNASGPVGLLVDGVQQMVPVRPSEVQEPPDSLGEAAADDAIIGVVPLAETQGDGAGGLVVLLSLDALLESLSADARAS